MHWRYSFCLVLLCAATMAVAQEKTEEFGFYRFPTVCGDRVVFTSEGDLWSAPLAGGSAQRLTVHVGIERFPLFSPDGKWIAFSGTYDGNEDVFVIPAGGGEPRRLTYHPASDQVCGWTPDGSVVFRSRSESPNYTYKLFKVSPQGGYPECLKLDQGATISYEPGGKRFAYTRVYLNFRTWKRYKGGWAEDIWVANPDKMEFAKITTYEGNDGNPMWYGDRIYYTRDIDGRNNIWSMKPDGSDQKQHTFQKEWDVRFPSLGQGLIVYQLAMDLWALDIATGKTWKLNITLPSDRLQSREKFARPDDYTQWLGLSPDGGRMLYVARGEIFTVPTERKGLIRRITYTMDAREKFPTFTPKGDSILCYSDKTGEEELFLYAANGKGEGRQITKGSTGWHMAPIFSPDGKYLLYADNDTRLNLLEMETGKIREIDRGTFEIWDYAWSPDGKYIAYTRPEPNELSSVCIYDVGGEKVVQVTDPMYDSGDITWDPEGKYLYFMSKRFFNPRIDYGNDWLYTFDKLTRPYALVLSSEEKSPFALKDDAKKEDKKDEEKDKKKDEDKGDKKEEEKKVEVKIDFEGLSDRIVEMPVKPGNYFNLMAVKGKIYYMSRENIGIRGQDLFEDSGPRAVLHLFDLEKKKDHEVMKGVASYAVSRDHKKVLVKTKDKYVLMDAGATKAPEPDEDDPEAGIHLEDLEVEVEPGAEWHQIFNEAWRLMRDFFYDPNMHGVDWLKVKKQYEPLVARISDRDELNDLIGEMVGELSVGHAYVGGGDRPRGKSVGVGLLGIDALPDKASGYYKITRILKGDSWDEKDTSPLGAPGLGVKEGDYLIAIDNRPVHADENYLELLVNKAGKSVVVTVNDKPTTEGSRDVIIKTLADEHELRYRDWVLSRRDYVQKRAGDQIAYVHLSDMMGDGLSQWGRDYFPQSKRPGLIMDVRYNGGGNVAEMILGMLERSVWSVGRPRAGTLRYHRPQSAFHGHMICLCNQETGSDGETFTEGFKRLKLGPVVGKRTWGGWVGIRGGKPLVDNGWYTQPEFSGWGMEGKWLIEGRGTDPDVDLENDPKSVLEGKDPQLDYVINYLLDKIKNEPMPSPPEPPYPNKMQK
jgi:tricorn protease